MKLPNESFISAGINAFIGLDLVAAAIIDHNFGPENNTSVAIAGAAFFLGRASVKVAMGFNHQTESSISQS